MMRYRRPDLNPSFESTAMQQRDQIKTAVAAGQHPKIDRSLWRDFKTDFAVQQQGKCGYCECSVVVTHFGDVEHFAPKSEVAEFVDGDDEGTETDFVGALQGRRPSLKVTPGYWWLAYEWSNYLLSCQVCNTVWKSSLFPVRHPPPRAQAPSETEPEDVLLLNPYGRRDPARHLQFGIDGFVRPRNNSIHGRETIRTCGLNRLALVAEREPIAAGAFAAVIDAAKQEQDGTVPEDNKGLQDLHRMGQSGRAARFPGMVRAIIVNELTPLTWDLLDELFSASTQSVVPRYSDPGD